MQTALHQAQPRCAYARCACNCSSPPAQPFRHLITGARACVDDAYILTISMRAALARYTSPASCRHAQASGAKYVTVQESTRPHPISRYVGTPQDPLHTLQGARDEGELPVRGNEDLWSCVVYTTGLTHESVIFRPPPPTPHPPAVVGPKHARYSNTWRNTGMPSTQPMEQQSSMHVD